MLGFPMSSRKNTSCTLDATCLSKSYMSSMSSILPLGLSMSKTSFRISDVTTSLRVLMSGLSSEYQGSNSSKLRKCRNDLLSPLSAQNTSPSFMSIALHMRGCALTPA